MSEKVNQGEIVESPPKRKRGRPRKEKPNNGIINEGESRILMEQRNSNSENVIGKEIMSQQEYERITVDKVSQRWGGLFQKYSSVITPNDISSILGRTSNYIRNDPFLNNYRVKQIISQGDKIDLSKLNEKFEDPANNEYTLAGVSWAMYYQSILYAMLVRIERETPTFNYYAIPELLDAEEYKKDSYKQEKKKVDSILRVLKPKTTFKDIIIQMQNEGKVFEIPRISYDDKQANFFVFQKLPAQYVKIVGFGSSDKFILMLNMAMFMNPMYDVGQYPPFIGEKWEEMLTNGVVNQDKNGYKFNPKTTINANDILEYNDDTWCYWYRLPQDMVFTFSMDGSHPLVIPDTLGILPDIVDLSQYKVLQQAALSRSVTSVLTAEVPYADSVLAGKDSTALSPDTILGFSDMFEQKVGETVLGYFAPFKNFKLLSVSDDIAPSTTIVSNRLKDVVNTSGMSGLLNLSDRPSVATVKTAQLIQEAKSKMIVAQFENAVNRIINESFDLKYKWKVKFWGYAFTLESEMKLMKELVLSGCKELLPRLLSGYDLTVEDYSSMRGMVDALDIEIIKDELRFTIEEGRKTQLASLGMKNQLGDVTKNPVGRPKMDDNDVENDSTSDSKDLGSNVSDSKEIYQNTMKQFVSEYLDEAMVSDLDADEVKEVLSEEIIAELENHDIVRDYQKGKQSKE